MDNRIQRAVLFIEDHFDERLCLQDIAMVACLSPGHFHRLFKRETGMTPLNYITNLKMNHAYTALITEGINVNELADQCGYSDYETFSRAFKKFFHLSPNDLKAIAHNIKNKLNIGPELLIIKGYTVEHPDDVEQKLEEIKQELCALPELHGFSQEDIQHAKVFAVTPKTHTPVQPNRLIKNKFVLTEDKNLLRALTNNQDQADE